MTREGDENWKVWTVRSPVLTGWHQMEFPWSREVLKKINLSSLFFVNKTPYEVNGNEKRVEEEKELWKLLNKLQKDDSTTELRELSNNPWDRKTVQLTKIVLISTEGTLKDSTNFRAYVKQQKQKEWPRRNKELYETWQDFEL